MKNKLLNELDGLRVAIEIEKRGHEFYQQAYNQSQEAEHKDLFLLLRDEETHHMEKFQKVLNKVQTTKSECESFTAETAAYLSALASDHVFPKEEEAARTIASLKTIDTILAVAMQAEKDSILLYDELAGKSKSEETRKVFAALKAEEQQHVVKLREMIDAWA
ncbi:MAG: ferritin family protein [Veillonellaceae bacterium]|jgi:rubrerythrin|nr:ferritin family protein [Veillonellaceae bacterium]